MVEEEEKRGRKMEKRRKRNKREQKRRKEIEKMRRKEKHWAEDKRLVSVTVLHHDKYCL